MLGTGVQYGGKAVCSTTAKNRSSIADGPCESARMYRTSLLSRIRIGIAVCVAAGFLAACGSTPEPTKSKFSPKKYGVKGSPKVVASGKPVPKGGGRYVVGKKYKIAGKWYYPKHEPNYKKTGLASWYGPTFHGRKTANGEIFDRNGLTAAHTTMPLPSYARVTNTANGRSMIVRVNDRGPFHGNRVIDLSERVASMLGTKGKGIGKVKVEYIGKARIDGRDEEYLMASYAGPGSVAPGASQPGTLFAKLTPKAPVTAARGPVVGPATPPAPRPYGLVTRVASAQSAPSYQIAFDPAVAFETSQSTIRVASLNTFTPKPVQARAPSAGTVSSAPPATPAAYAPPAQPGTLGVLRIPATGAPQDLTAGSAISSYVANDRIAAAHAISGIAKGSSVRLSELARLNTDR